MSVLSFLFKDKSHDDASHPSAPPSQAPAAHAAPPTASPGAPASPRGEVLDFDEIRHALDQIAEVLGRGEGYDMLKTSTGDVTAVELPLVEVMGIKPSLFCQEAPAPADEDRKVSVLVEDIFGQLGRGKIATSMANLVADVPSDYLCDQVESHHDELVNIPLALIVGAINPNELRKRTANVERDMGVQDLPNLFSATSAPVDPATLPEQMEVVEEAAPAEPELTPEEAEAVVEVAEAIVASSEPAVVAAVEEPPAPVAEAVVETPVAPPSPEPVAEEQAPEPVAAEAPLPQTVRFPERATATETLHAEIQERPAAARVAKAAQDHVLLLRGLDLNEAGAQTLVTRLDGIGPRLAQRIVENREAHGPFLDLLDLARVPGLGRKTFTKITGMRWPEGEEALPEMRSNILSFSTDGFLSVKDVAHRFGQQAGFDGCVVAHQDGYVLATSWNHKADEALGAFVPQIFKKVERYIKRLHLGEMDCMTVILDQRPITFVPSEDIYFVAVHQVGAISRKHVRLAHGVGCRLGRLLKRRTAMAA